MSSLPPSSSIVSLVEDFNAATINTAGSIGALGWLTLQSSGGAYSNGPSSWPNIGIETLSTGTTSGYYSQLYLSSNAYGFGANAGWSTEWIAAPASGTLANGGFRLGYWNSGSAAKVGSNGIYFRYDTNAGDTAIMACVSNSSAAETCVTTGTAPSAGTYTDYFISSTVAGKVTYQVNATPAVTACPSGCNLTTSFTSTAIAPAASVVTYTTAAESLSLDYFKLYITGLSR